MAAVIPVDLPDERWDASTLGRVAIAIAGVHTGNFTLNGATNVAVADTNVTAASVISFQFKTLGGTDGRNQWGTSAWQTGRYPKLVSTTPGTGFSVVGLAGDTSIYSYAIVG